MKLSDELIGRTFGPNGQYRIEKKLGEGGMGVVFKAVDVPHDRIVALKFLRTDGAVDADLIARFKNEGTRCAAVRHPTTSSGSSRSAARRAASTSPPSSSTARTSTSSW